MFTNVSAGGGALVTRSCPTLAIPWTVPRQASLSMGFSRQEYWSGLPFPSPGDLPNPGIELSSLASPALAGRLFTTEPLGKPFWPRVLEKRPLMPGIFIKLVFGIFFPLYF